MASAGRSIRIAALTVSDGVAAGTRQDTSGAAIVHWVAGRGSELVEHSVVPDDRGRIRRTLERLVDDADADVVITTGGTGLTSRDVTPEATDDVLHRHLPGIAEEIRRHGLASTPYAILSRGLSGSRHRSLIVNLPGSTGGVHDGLAVLDAVLDHAVQLLRDVDTGRHDHPAEGGDA
jgi:molybdenum cofactor synthesis domain-containing protein